MSDETQNPSQENVVLSTEEESQIKEVEQINPEKTSPPKEGVQISTPNTITPATRINNIEGMSDASVDTALNELHRETQRGKLQTIREESYEKGYNAALEIGEVELENQIRSIAKGYFWKKILLIFIVISIACGSIYCFLSVFTEKRDSAILAQMLVEREKEIAALKTEKAVIVAEYKANNETKLLEATDTITNIGENTKQMLANQGATILELEAKIAVLKKQLQKAEVQLDKIYEILDLPEKQ